MYRINIAILTDFANGIICQNHTESEYGFISSNVYIADIIYVSQIVSHIFIILGILNSQSSKFSYRSLKHVIYISTQLLCAL
jgi:hypothetical protein